MYCTAPLSPRKGRLRSFRDGDDDDDDDHSENCMFPNFSRFVTTPRVKNDDRRERELHDTYDN